MKAHLYQAKGGEMTGEPAANDIFLIERASDHVALFIKYSTLLTYFGTGGGGTFNGGIITAPLTITPAGGVNANALVANAIIRAAGGDGSHAGLVVTNDASFLAKATFTDVSLLRQATNTLRVTGNMKVDEELQADGFVGRYLTIGSINTSPILFGDAGSGEMFFNAVGGEIFRTMDTSLWISQQLRFSIFTPDRVVGWDIAGNIVEANTDMLPVGSLNQYFTNALAVGALLTDMDLMISPSSVTTSDTVLGAFAKLELRTLVNDAKVGFTNAGVDARITSTWRGVANGLASLDSGGKVLTSQLPSSITGQVSYIGTWNATTNTPTIPAAAIGNKGWFYIVNVAGTTTINGVSSWAVGDWIISDGITWSKVDNTDSVSTVFGRQGAIVANTGDYTTAQVTESGNLFFTEARVRAAVLTGISVGSGGAISAADSVLTAFGKLQFRVALNDAKVGFTDALVRAAVLTGLSVATSTAVVAADSVLVAIGKAQAQINTINSVPKLSLTGGNVTGTTIFRYLSDDILKIESAAYPKFIFQSTDSNLRIGPIQLLDMVTLKPRASILQTDDDGFASHGRFACYGENKTPAYANWNCGAIEAHNNRSVNADSRIGIIRFRGVDWGTGDPEDPDADGTTSGRIDCITYNRELDAFRIGLHQDEYGRVGIGHGNGYPFPDAPTAWLMLAPGVNTPNGAPLKLRVGTLLTTPEDGAIEYDGASFYATVGSTRSALGLFTSVLVVGDGPPDSGLDCYIYVDRTAAPKMIYLKLEGSFREFGGIDY